MRMNFITDFLSLNLTQYENFGINFPIGMVIVIFSVAMCVAFFIYNYRKRYTAFMLKQLIRHNATSAENAKTLKDIHLEKNLYLKSALSGSGQLTYLVKSADASNPTYEEYVTESKKRGFKEKKINFEEAKFYVHEERVNKAKRIVETSNTEWWRPILFSAIVIVLLVISAIFLPEILNSINSSVK